MKPIPYGKQFISQDDINAVIETLTSDHLTQGPKIREFEDAFANYIGCKHAVAVSNGTAALHLSAMALDVNRKSKVITTPITFAATANCVRYCEGEIFFCDIDPKNYLLDIDKVRFRLKQSPKGTYAGIIPVDFGGLAVQMDEFRKLADDFGLWIIEDACHAPGAFFKDEGGSYQKCGNGVYADLSVFSFHPVKHIACGEGGMITTNNSSLYKKLLTLRTHGITRNESDFQNNKLFASGENEEKYPGWYMEMQHLGYNYRLTDFQAALGLSQLSKADAGLKRRKDIAKSYDEAFKNSSVIKSLGLELKDQPSGHAYHLYVIEVSNRLELYDRLREDNIFTQVHYIPAHLMPYYRSLGWKEGDCPIAEQYYQRCLSLPLFPSLSDEELRYVIEKVKLHAGG